MRVYGERKATVVVRTLQHSLQARCVEVAELGPYSVHVSARLSVHLIAKTLKTYKYEKKTANNTTC